MLRMELVSLLLPETIHRKLEDPSLRMLTFEMSRFHLEPDAGRQTRIKGWNRNYLHSGDSIHDITAGRKNKVPIKPLFGYVSTLCIYPPFLPPFLPPRLLLSQVSSCHNQRPSLPTPPTHTHTHSLFPPYPCHPPLPHPT